MLRFLTLFVVIGLVNTVQASVFGEHVRSADTADKYPEKLVVGRFSEAVVGNTACDWENAGSIALKTDRGNIDISSYRIAPIAIKISCQGKRAFYVIKLPPKYLQGNAQEGDVGIWFGNYKERYGCEGYIGCDKVHVLHTYHSSENINEPEGELQGW
ncbi:MAG: hypothetical protein V3T17_05160 [Pseudomonadales bacterium]